MSLLDHTFVSALPTPLAVALQTLLDEQEARCAILGLRAASAASALSAGPAVCRH